MGTWWTLHLRWILYAPGVINVHGDVLQISLEPGLSSSELSVLSTEQQRPQEILE